MRGRLGDHFASAFDGMTLEPGPGQTVLTGEIRDQAHLYGLLDRLRDFGIELLAVEPQAQQMPALTVARSCGLAPEQVMGKLSDGPLPRPAQMAGASPAAHLALA